MTKRLPYWYFVAGLFLFLGLASPTCVAAQETTSQSSSTDKGSASSPEKLPKVLSEASTQLSEKTAALQAKLKSSQQALNQGKKEIKRLRAKAAALKASMALKKLNLAQAEEELKVLTERQTRVDDRIKGLLKEQETLAQNIEEHAKSFKSLKQEVAELKKSKHPVFRSQELQSAFRKYQGLAKDYEVKAGKYKDSLKKLLQGLNEVKLLLAETIILIEKDYLEKTLKEELLKRQSLKYRLEQMANTLKTLAAMPERALNWLVYVIESGALLDFIKEKWAPLAGLLFLLILLGWGASRLKALVVPGLQTWQARVEEVGLQALFSFSQILSAHLFSIGFALWLYIAFWTLGIIGTEGGWLIVSGVATLVALRLSTKFVKTLFAGQAQGGIFPLDDDTAGFYRRHLRLLVIYFFIVGIFVIPNARYLGFAPDSTEFIRYAFQVVLLAWILWLMRSRYLDRLLEELPVPAFLRRKGVIRAIRSAVFLVFGFVIISGMLGFRFLSDFVAEAAAFTVVVAALAWILGEGAKAILRLVIHPETGIVAEKYPEREPMFKKLYTFSFRAVVVIVVLVSVMVALRVWGVRPGRLAWLLQWLTWGPAIGPIKLTALNIGLTILIIYLGFWVSRLIRTFMELKFYPTTDWDTGIQYTISTTIHYVVLVITVLIALNTMGVSFTSLALVAGGLGVGIGFGLQNIVSNFVSGLILLFERPIKVGDMLVIDGQWGMVQEIRVRSTIFQTFDRYTLIIPNSELLSGKILNWTHFGWGINRLTLKVGVSYGSDVRQVTKILEEVCRANPRVLNDPPPSIYFEAYGDSSLNFNIWVYLSTPGDRIPATHELNSAIFEAFNEHGIEIPFPQRDLHIKSWPAETAGIVPFPDKE